MAQFLKGNRNAQSVVFGSMADAFNNSTQYMTNDDLRAIAHSLKSLFSAADVGVQAKGDASVASLPILNLAGQRTFAAKCAACHGVGEAGRGPWIPPLAGATSSVKHLASVSGINVMLNGSARVAAAGVPDSFRIPSSRDHLSDKDVADVLSFVRGSWGNHGGMVRREDVRALRDATIPARNDVIVPQMR